jgi:hypothetical protein
LQGHLQIMLSQSHALSGWNPTEKSINFGWKNYGADWYGHDARWRSSSLLARINTRHRVAIVISSERFTGSDPVYLVLARMFGEIFPDLVTIDVPALLGADAARDMDYTVFTGVYRTRASEVILSQDPQGLFLRVPGGSISGGAASSPGRTYRLRAARENVFLTSPAELEVFPYLQFLGTSAGGCYDYLWNGHNLWRRMDSGRS